MTQFATFSASGRKLETIIVLVGILLVSFSAHAQTLTCGLGARWIEEEGGLPSTWTRRGTSSVFDAIYPTIRVTTVNTVTVSGSKVYITRTSGSDGNLCSYDGTVDPDGETITGTYKCLNGSALWRATVICDSRPPRAIEESHSGAPATGASIVQAVIRGGATSLQLRPGQIYLYGMATGGGAPSSAFTVGQSAQVVNAAGNLSGALAYGANSQNSYSTETAYHDIGGVSVAGSWEHFAAYYGSNPQSGAHVASVSFDAKENSLVVVLGLASSQQSVSVEGIPELQVDASRDGGGMVIAHAYVKAGTYTVVEHSRVLAAGQDPPHMADLVGAFVFGGRQASTQHAVASEQPHAASIHGVDFLNFDYQSTCQDGVIHVSKGEWQGDARSSFRVVKTIYGDLMGGGNEEAVIHTLFDHGANWACNEIFVFAISPSGPKLLARLTPQDWGKGEEDNGGNFHVSDIQVSKQQLAVGFLAGGSHACPAWTVTVRFQWNGSGFVRSGVSRKPFICQTQ